MSNKTRIAILLNIFFLLACAGSSPRMEPDSAIIRARTALNNKDPKSALKIIGDDIRARGTSVENVDPSTAILMASAYRDSGDTDQALAWFSQAYSNPIASSEVRRAAERGVEDTIALIPQEQYAVAASRWGGSSFVGRFFGNQRNAQTQISPLSPQSPQPITVALPLSGKFMKLGESFRKGLELAGLTETNLIDESTPNDQAPLQALLGPLTSEAVPQFVNLAQTRGVPLLNLAKNEASEKLGVVELGVTPRSQIEPLINFAAKKLGLKKFGIIYPESDQGSDYADALNESLQLLGLAPVFELSYPKDDLNSLPKIAVQVEEYRDVEAILFADKISSAAYFFSLVREETRQNLRPLGIASWGNKAELKNSQAVLNRALFVMPYLPTSEKPQVRTFNSAFQSKYNEQPDILSAQGYDVGKMIKFALERQQTDRTQFLYALSRITPYEGVTGTIRISPVGEVNREYPVVEFLDGRMYER